MRGPAMGCEALQWDAGSEKIEHAEVVHLECVARVEDRKAFGVYLMAGAEQRTG